MLWSQTAPKMSGFSDIVFIVIPYVKERYSIQKNEPAKARQTLQTILLRLSNFKQPSASSSLDPSSAHTESNLVRAPEGQPRRQTYKVVERDKEETSSNDEINVALPLGLSGLCRDGCMHKIAGFVGDRIWEKGLLGNGRRWGAELIN